MLLTESLAYLRQIDGDWTATDIPQEKLSALQAANLIEIRTDPVQLVRLTATGHRCKAIAESPRTITSSSPQRSAKQSRNPGQRHAKPVRQLV